MTSRDGQNPQLLPGEVVYADELRFLTAWDQGERPLGWRRTPRAAVTFIVGSGDEHLQLTRAERTDPTLPRSLRIGAKFVGDRALIERCVVTLAGERGLLLVGEPGT